MHRISRSLSELLPPVRLFKEDVKDLHAAFSAATDKVSVSDTVYVYDDLEEVFTKAPSELKAFRIMSEAPAVALDIERGRSPHLYARRDDPVSAGVFYRVRQVAFTRRRRFRAWLTSSSAVPLILLVVMFLGAAAAIAVAAVFKDTPQVAIPALVAGISVCALYGVLGWIATDRRVSLIYLVHRNARPSWIRRNRDMLIVGLLSAAGGAVITVLLDRLAA